MTKHAGGFKQETRTFTATLEEKPKRLLALLKEHGGDVSASAKTAGVHRATLTRWVRRLGLLEAATGLRGQKKPRAKEARSQRTSGD